MAACAGETKLRAWSQAWSHKIADGLELRSAASNVEFCQYPLPAAAAAPQPNTKREMVSGQRPVRRLAGGEAPVLALELWLVELHCSSPMQEPYTYTAVLSRKHRDIPDGWIGDD